MLYKEFQETSRIGLWYQRRGGEIQRHGPHVTKMPRKCLEAQFPLSRSNSLLDMLCRRGTISKEEFLSQGFLSTSNSPKYRENGKMLERIKPNPQKLLVSHIKRLKQLFASNTIPSDSNSQVFPLLTIHLLIKLDGEKTYHNMAWSHLLSLIPLKDYRLIPKCANS